MNDETQNNL